MVIMKIIIHIGQDIHILHVTVDVHILYMIADMIEPNVIVTTEEAMNLE